MSYRDIVKREGRWFRVAFRWAIAKYPCQRCSFALATRAESDAAFGLGYPIFCSDCVPSSHEYVEVPKSAYDRDARAVVEALGDLWTTPRVP